ncbi:alpha-2-macroglobulin family protein [Paucibacter sp. Y2R2-4]|uniref:alpha-2-macroglobulin family protein n=1 Tax=Paucibacter sp. Y2R2-4 TaxID=2893553 RepID=UPI0021E37D7C|nr:MG2 domain-containing protein [Paucibacter sp. Y2R2-4]MCV2349554.1 alpha-2-macroglobulin [Paucibacter sp. Y2R2-4]
MSVSPSGTVAQVRQIRLAFSEAAVPGGDAQLPVPAELSCEGVTKLVGSGRWSRPNEWLFDLNEPLDAGKKCKLQIKDSFKPLGSPLQGAREFNFATGAAIALNASPWPGSDIEEDQHFLLHLNGVIEAAAVARQAWCEVEGVGERLPVQVVTGPVRDAVLKSQQVRKGQDRVWLLHCQRPLAPGAKVQLLWQAEGANARAAQRFEYTVRRPFTVDFTCERERANAPCLPIRPMRVVFSEPVPREEALKIRLKPQQGAALAPKVAPEDKQPELNELRFPMPLAENAQFTIELPASLKDRSGRSVSNGASFPLKISTGAAPPLAKFAAAPFGVIEREAQGPAMLPITMRHVQSDWSPSAGAPSKPVPGEIRIKRLQSDAEVFAWYQKLRKFHESQLSAQEAGFPSSQWEETVKLDNGRGQQVERRQPRYVGSREVALLAADASVQVLPLPAPQEGKGGESRPFEVIGLPLAEPGYHVVELSSRRLGVSLLDKAAPMYVRTGVLVTNLGVHFKWGRENSLVWVTSLDKAQPVAQAEVTVNDCRGKPLWTGRTDAQGLAPVPLALKLPAWNDKERCEYEQGFFVTARKSAPGPGDKLQQDMSFVFSNWSRGIENWRFAVPTARGAESDARAHTVLDRSLLRAGETVSMKHFFRFENSQGLSLARADQLPTRVRLTHEGSGQQIDLPLSWPSPRSSVSQWQIPANAKLGLYRITLEKERGTGEKTDMGEERQHSWPSGDFRVEEFRVPLIDARLSGPKAIPIAPRELRLSAQLNYLSGGGVGPAPLKLSAVMRPRAVSFAGYEAFAFEPPRSVDASASSMMDDSESGDEGNGGAAVGSRLVVDKQPGMTDRNGAAELLIKTLPKIERPSELVAELSYSDPNGEIKTAARTLPLWPSKLVLGLRSQGWASNVGKAGFSVVALDTAGKAQAGQRIEVQARLRQTISSRKRMVGGFYAYDNQQELKDLGSVCSGSTDAQGLLSCEAKLDVSGEVELIASAKDADGRASVAANSVWMTRQGELWFAQDNDDRIDVLAEKKRYEPGETARLQVRMPYREATALLTIEREGVIESRIVKLRGSDPTVELKIEKNWAPNVYVSVLALRGRIFEVPWYSFFQWGWRQPVGWWHAWRDAAKHYQAPTALIDLAKPSYKLGMAELQVGLAAHQLQVEVSTDKPQYGVRQTVQTRIKVTQDGRPLADAEVAFAAVDEGLLALRNNASWELLPALIQKRAWGVETATAQSEIIGRRHYGRKAVAAGGGGGRAPTRELFETLLLWKPSVKLDAKGEALIEVPLNDSLSSFRLVAVADAGAQRFGTGQATLRVTQDLQVLSGLPPLVREGDQFQAMLTLRNSSSRAMKLRVGLQAQAGQAAMPALAAQELSLAAGAAGEARWMVTVPDGVSVLNWEAQVQELGGGSAAAGSVALAADRLKVQQQVRPAVALQVQQASLSQLDGSMNLAMAPPADALPMQGVKRGGVNVFLQAKLGGDLAGPRRYFENYPYSCLEQLSAKALGLHDAAQWQSLMTRLPGYLDADGLASYFPPQAGAADRGSDRLTAHLLAAAHEAGREIPEAQRRQMLDGLAAFVEGRIQRKAWSPRSAQLDLAVRRVAALEALSRYGRATQAGLSALDTAGLPAWPTAALIDWLNLHRRMAQAPDRARRIAEAQSLLRSRLTYSGTRLGFSTEQEDDWWWLMDSADANASRLILAVVDDPAWAAEMPRLVQGTLARQRQGAWRNTTANLWGVLALDKFSARFESGAKLTGKTQATLGAQSQSLEWASKPEGGAFLLPWGANATPAAPATLKLQQEGATASAKPWVTLQSLAAVPLKTALNSGYRITRTVQAVEQKTAGRWSRGDLMRVRLELDAQSDMTWVALSDPVPAGALILGGGLGGQSSLALQPSNGERSELAGMRPSYEERSFEAWRAYFEYLPRGKHVMEYTVRLNNAGRFMLPGSRAEAMYAPDVAGELPQALLEVAP